MIGIFIKTLEIVASMHMTCVSWYAFCVWAFCTYNVNASECLLIAHNPILPLC